MARAIVWPVLAPRQSEIRLTLEGWRPLWFNASDCTVNTAHTRLSVTQGGKRGKWWQLVTSWTVQVSLRKEVVLIWLDSEMFPVKLNPTLIVHGVLLMSDCRLLVHRRTLGFLTVWSLEHNETDSLTLHKTTFYHFGWLSISVDSELSKAVSLPIQNDNCRLIISHRCLLGARHGKRRCQRWEHVLSLCKKDVPGCYTKP